MMRLNEIAFAVREAEHQLHEWQRSYDAKVKEVTETLRSIRAQCPHPRVINYPDAAGGNDDLDVCELCGEHLP